MASSNREAFEEELESSPKPYHVLPKPYEGRHLIVTVIRTTTENFKPETCCITAQGYKDSKRTEKDGVFKIGRQQVTEKGDRPNDLTLPATDRAISRVHCMINYKAFFDNSLPTIWLTFLMGTHPRLGRASIVQFFPMDIIRYILNFLKEEKLPLLIDLGSMCGTYVKVSNTQPIELKIGQVFLVGSDINIEVDRICNNPSKSISEDFGQATLTSFEKNNPEGLPYVIIKIAKYHSDNEETMQPYTYRFFAQEALKKYTIGRSQICDVQLPENTISRTQCRIVYRNLKWAILDGIDSKPTVNGTWLSISSSEHCKRTVSETYPLQKKTQIKISDTILQVDWD